MVHERSLPAILIGHTAHIAGTTSVVPDYAAAARLALGLLVRHGHRNIGIMGGPFGSHDPRLAEMSCAISDAGAELGVIIDPQNVFAGNLTFEAGVAAVNQMTARSFIPTALLCLAENAAMGVLAAAQNRGIQVPARLSVVTFADHNGTMDSCMPMSTVVLPVDELASVAVKEADRQLREGIPTDAAKITVGARLIERDTCGPAKR